jgi:hypothetical protein
MSPPSVEQALSALRVIRVRMHGRRHACPHNALPLPACMHAAP